MVDDSDETLGARLDSALRSGLDLGQVDVATLVEGSRHRARQVRTRRIAAAVASAALVLAVPVGYEVVNPGGQTSSQPAAMLPSGSRSPADRALAPTARPKPTAVPSVVPPPGASSALIPGSTGSTSPSGPSGSPTRAVPTSIPDSFASFTAAQLPAGVSLERTAPLTVGVLVAGQECRSQSSGRSSAVRPVSGRQWVWAAGTGAENRSVSLTITGWAGDDSAIAFRQAITDTGDCRWAGPQKVRELTVRLGEESWAATSSAGKQHYARTLVRIGNGIVGVQVQDPDGVGPAAALADRLARIQVTRMAPD
jgi:hypothetical protein